MSWLQSPASDTQITHRNRLWLYVLAFFVPAFLIVPTLAVGIGILFAMFPELLRVPWVVLGASVSALVLPMVFEAAGWWRETWKLEGGQFVADPSVVTFDGTAGKVFLIGHWDKAEVPDPYRLGEESHQLAYDIISHAVDQWVGKL